MAVDWSRPYEASFRLALVDRSSGAESPAGGLLVRGGSAVRDDGTAVKESADVSVVGDLDADPMLVRLYADVAQGGEAEAVALGTYVANVTGSSFEGGARVLSVELDGRLSELSGDAFDAPFTVEAGTPAVAYAAGVARAAGFEVDCDESTYLVSQARSYGLDDESKLDVINDLLNLAGFSSARTDPYGRVLMRRYVEPAERPPAASYGAGGGPAMLASVTDECDTSEVANVVICTYSTQDGTVVGSACDADPTSRWSTVARGRRIVRRYRYDDLVAQQEADAKAASLLSTAQSAVRTVGYTAAFDPAVTIGSAVDVDRPDAGVSGRFAVRTQRIDLSGGAMLVATEARAYVRR